jgi:hypothetical protein
MPWATGFHFKIPDGPHPGATIKTMALYPPMSTLPISRLGVIIEVTMTTI